MLKWVSTKLKKPVPISQRVLAKIHFHHYEYKNLAKTAEVYMTGSKQWVLK
jgi:predicted metal-binding transcription factor (methanogenesis marker protein 9)